jgi:hypothetical protein
LTDVGSNSRVFKFSLPDSATIAHLGYKDGKWLVVEFYLDPGKVLGQGSFATAFIPKGSQLAAMKRLAGLPM